MEMFCHMEMYGDPDFGYRGFSWDILSKRLAFQVFTLVCDMCGNTQIRGIVSFNPSVGLKAYFVGLWVFLIVRRE